MTYVNLAGAERPPVIAELTRPAQPHRHRPRASQLPPPLADPQPPHRQCAHHGPVRRRRGYFHSTLTAPRGTQVFRLATGGQGETERDELVSSKPPKLDVKVIPSLTEDRFKALIKAWQGQPTLRYWLVTRSICWSQQISECVAPGGHGQGFS